MGNGKSKDDDDDVGKSNGSEQSRLNGGCYWLDEVVMRLDPGKEVGSRKLKLNPDACVLPSTAHPSHTRTSLPTCLLQ